MQRYAHDPSPNPEANENGPRKARHARTPDYFSEFRERPDMTSFLGGCIYAKVRLHIVAYRNRPF